MTVLQAAHRTAFPVMGTTASIHVDDDIPADGFDAVVCAVRGELCRLEQMFSIFRADSEISRINDGTLHHLDASPEVIEVLDACAWLENASGGAFSVRRAPGETRIDPSGFVKGWAAERAARLFAAAGIRHWYLGVGGDFVAGGGMRNGAPWRIGIIDPRDVSMLVGTVDVTDGAVATSGTAERGAHLWDPRTGRPAGHFLSVTVTGPSLALADAYATTVFVMGEPGLDWVSQFAGYSVLPVRRG
ncbi:MAG: FAD:protein FMN transferase [Actinomycetota bacterium]